MKHYTFNVTGSFRMQFTFNENEVELEAGGNEGDFEPTYEAIIELEAELRECLEQKYGATDVEAFADSDSLLGIADDNPV